MKKSVTWNTKEMIRLGKKNNNMLLKAQKNRKTE